MSNKIKPFWSWNDKLRKEELVRQIELMKESGIEGFFMHARGGLKTEYMGDDWFDCIKACMDKADELGMEAWAYDENGWPSGFANGSVPKKGVDFQQKRLETATLNKGDRLPENLLGLYRVSENGFESINAAENGCFAVYYTVNPYYIDTFNEEAVGCFINETHERYYERFGDRFGKSLKGFFTDEPQYGNGATPWSALFPEMFLKEYGYSLTDNLPLLYFDFDGTEKFRSDFYNMAARQFRTSFIKQMYDWCTEHNCRLTGHMMAEDTFGSQLGATGGVMACYEYFHEPGIDWLGRKISTPFIPKQLGSVARQLGRKTLTESFALCGWDVSLNELKWIMQWQMVNGVTSLCPHLEGYSLRGERKRDYPASVFYQLPWFKEAYKPFAEFICKTGTLLDKGLEEAPILLIEPLQTAYIKQNPKNEKKINELQSNFENITNELSGNHILYHYGDESIMEHFGSVKKNKLVIGKCEYSTVIMPYMQSLTENTLKLLTEFSQNGGKLYFIGEMPSLVNGAKDERLKLLKAEKADLDAIKREYGFADITTDGKENKNIHYTKRVTDNGDRIYYLVNLSDEEQCVTVNTKEDKVYLYDVITEKAAETDGKLTFAPYESFMLISSETVKPEKADSRKTEYISINREFKVSESTVNALTLDFCRYRTDGGEWQPETAVILLQRKLLELKRPCKIELEFSFNAESGALTDNICLCAEMPESFEFFINGKPFEFKDDGYYVDKSIRKSNISEYVIQGKNTITLKGEFYQSEDVYRVLFTPGIHESEKNKLTYDTELESIYITGSFGVRAEDEISYGERKSIFAGRRFTLTEMPKTVDISKITESGFWFFSGAMELTGNISVNKKENTKYVLSLKKLNAPAARLDVNGEKAAVLIFAPYSADITDYLKNGENELKITLLSGNRNLLGPHHKPQGEIYSVGPSTFTDKHGWADDKSKPAWTDNYSFVKFGIDNTKSIH